MLQRRVDAGMTIFLREHLPLGPQVDRDVDLFVELSV